MTTTSKPSFRNPKTCKWKMFSFGVLFAMTLAALAQSKVTDTNEGTFVTIGDHKMYLQCQGPKENSPVVVFESGGGGTSKDWDKVRSYLPPGFQTCAYDRAGLGKSEAGPAPRTMHQEVFELHALLTAAKLTGPVVLVGQSMGGLLNRLYVERYGSNVVGVVLVDPTDENGILGSIRYGGLVRLREKASSRPVPEPRLQGKPATAEFKPEDDFIAEEFQGIYLSRKLNPRPFGQRPLIVLGAGKRTPPPGATAEQWNRQRQERDEQAKAQAELSGNAKFILDPTSGHGIHAENPQLVSKAIEEVVASIVSGKPLSAQDRP
jgi:pimeloyl-ACP methyl ester carboxylesterase